MSLETSKIASKAWHKLSNKQLYRPFRFLLQSTSLFDIRSPLSYKQDWKVPSSNKRYSLLSFGRPQLCVRGFAIHLYNQYVVMTQNQLTNSINHNSVTLFVCTRRSLSFTQTATNGFEPGLKANCITLRLPPLTDQLSEPRHLFLATP